MFTVLSNTRNSRLYLIAALASMVVVLLTIALASAKSAPQPLRVPLTGISEAASDYYQRHPEARVPAPVQVDATDFYQRHPDWTIAPVTINSAASDYFQRHPELVAPAEASADMTDYYFRQRGSLPASTTADLTDYFFRHR